MSASELEDEFVNAIKIFYAIKRSLKTLKTTVWIQGCENWCCLCWLNLPGFYTAKEIDIILSLIFMKLKSNNIVRKGERINRV